MKLKDSSLYVGLFLALRDIRRSNIWTTILIVFIMTLTFINMNLVGGILVGLARGVEASYKHYYSGDILIIPQTSKQTLSQTQIVISAIESLPTKKAYAVRYIGPAVVEYGYKTKIRPTDISESASTELVGIDPIKENAVTDLSKTIVAGSYLSSSDVDEILVGASLIEKYSSVRGSQISIGAKLLKNADVGSRVKLLVNGVEKEVRIKGIVLTDGTNIDNRIFMVDTAARHLLGRDTLSADEIALLLQPNSSSVEAKKFIQKNIPNNSDIIVQTAVEALPGGIADVLTTFGIMGNVVGSIALIVGAMTIFIVIFVNAVTRRKYIGILKGIGISPKAIEFSYILQALFYSLSGIIVSSILIFGLVVPYFQLHPISYPIAKGSIDIGLFEVTVKGFIFAITAFISGFIPAWIVTKQNTLDSILGRS